MNIYGSEFVFTNLLIFRELLESHIWVKSLHHGQNIFDMVNIQTKSNLKHPFYKIVDGQTFVPNVSFKAFIQYVFAMANILLLYTFNVFSVVLEPVFK